MARRHTFGIRAALLVAIAAFTVTAAAQSAGTLDAQLDALEAQVVAGEDVAAIKRLQRQYGYYVDKGMWEDVADLYMDDAVANYPAGTYVGRERVRAFLFNVFGNEGPVQNRLGKTRAAPCPGRAARSRRTRRRRSRSRCACRILPQRAVPP